MTDASLRPVTHPGQSDTLVHFCGRARQDVPTEIARQSASERLGNILASETLKAFPPYGAKLPATCFSESTPAGVESLLRIQGFEGWGLVVSRDHVWRAGGGPVWYTRSDIWYRAKPQLDDDLHIWMVQIDPGRADWLHKREWRVPAPLGHLKVQVSSVVAVIVSDLDWRPPMVSALELNPNGHLAHVERTPAIAATAPRWFWNGTSIEQVAAIPLEANFFDEV
jgi:hypothetical protein